MGALVRGGRGLVAWIDRATAAEAPAAAACRCAQRRGGGTHSVIDCALSGRLRGGLFSAHRPATVPRVYVTGRTEGRRPRGPALERERRAAGPIRGAAAQQVLPCIGVFAFGGGACSDARRAGRARMVRSPEHVDSRRWRQDSYCR